MCHSNILGCHFFDGVCFHDSDPCCNVDCDDGDPCTTDSCDNGACSNVPMDCDDADDCTTDSCEDGACVHTLDDPCCGIDDPCCGNPCCEACNDFDPCTYDYCGPGGTTDCVNEGSLDLVYEGVAEEDEEDPGGFLALNDDDDDNSGTADKDDPPNATADDDLHRVLLSADYPDPSVMVTLSLTCPAPVQDCDSFVKVYEDDDRSMPTTMPASWALSDMPDHVYVEGTGLSSSPRDVELKLSTNLGCEDIVKLTVIGVQAVEWVAMDSPLYGNPNAGGGKQIFPGGTTPFDLTNRRKVKVRATITPPVDGADVYFKAFDVDDPSASAPPLDDETQATDNRQPTYPQPVPASKLTDVLGRAEVEFEVSMQPGNNHKIVASCLTDYFANLQSRQADGTQARVENTYGWFVPSNNITELLTVWRRLHIELDSMGPVTGNAISASFTDIVGTGTHLWEVKGLTASLDDGSLNLDDTPIPGFGRFRDGELDVGVFGTHTFPALYGNGDNRVQLDTEADISGLFFTANDNDDSGNGIISGTLTQVLKVGGDFVWVLNVTYQNENPIDWPDFVDGDLYVGGGTAQNITFANGQANALTTAGMSVPCTVRDDDDNTLLPKLPDTGTMTSAFKEAYVVPVYDVGNWNQAVPFQLNIPLDPVAVGAAMEWNTRVFNSDSFWVAYVLECFQADAAIFDNDPNSEMNNLGATLWHTGGSLIFLEQLQVHEENPDPIAAEQDTVVHETGHAVGNSDAEPVTDGSSHYVDFYLDSIRLSPRPAS